MRKSLLAVIAVIALATTACSGSTTTASPGGSAAASAPASAPAESAAPAASPSAASSASGEAVTLDVLTWEPGGPDYWKALVDAFEAKNPNIKIKLEAVPFEKWAETEGPYIASKSGPDVMMNNVGFELMERKDAYLPINDRITSDITDSLVTTTGGCEDFDTTKPCYGLGFGYQGNVMYYNKKILTDAGLDPANPPQTWDDFGKACDAIKKIGKACVAMGASGIFPAYWVFPEIARNYLTQSDIVDFSKGKIPWTDPRLVNTLKGMADMGTKGWFQDGAAGMTMLPDGADVFSRGDAAFAGTIISDAVNWKVFGEALGDANLGAMRWPSIVADAPLAKKFSGVEGAIYGITTWSQHPDQAWEFIKFLTSKENADLFLKIGGSQPLNKNFDRTLVPNSEAFNQIQQIISDPTLHSGVLLTGREADALSKGFAQVIQGEITVDQWTQSMQQALLASPEKNKP